MGKSGQEGNLRLRLFSPNEIKIAYIAKGWSFGDFMRALIIAAPDYGSRGENSDPIKPANNHIRDIINGETEPGPTYLALFADVLSCKVDTFFVRVQKGE